MSITFPKSWTTGEKLLAEDIRLNAKELQKKQQSTLSSDFDLLSKWYETNHIMDNRYSPTDNISVNVSGVFAGQTNNGLLNNLSYASRWISNGQAVLIPLASITFDILAPCSIVFMWSMVHQSATDGDGVTGSTTIAASVNSPAITGISSAYLASEQPNTSSLPVLIDGTTQSNGVVVLNRSAPVKNFSLGLTGNTTAGKCQNVSFNISLECFYL